MIYACQVFLLDTQLHYISLSKGFACEGLIERVIYSVRESDTQAPPSVTRREPEEQILS